MSYLYIAQPYDKLAEKQHAINLAMRVVTLAAVEGIPVFAPILHNGPLSRTEPYAAAAQTIDWVKLDLDVLRGARAMLILGAYGWKESDGIAKEIQFCNDLDIPVHMTQKLGSAHHLIDVLRAMAEYYEIGRKAPTKYSAEWADLLEQTYVSRRPDGVGEIRWGFKATWLAKAESQMRPPPTPFDPLPFMPPMRAEQQNGAGDRVFATGATRSADIGKPDYEGYLSPLVMEAFGRYMLRHQKRPNGDTRASDNWQNGVPKAAYIKSAFRHFIAWWSAHRTPAPPEVVEENICALLFNAQGYLHEHLRERLGRS